MAIRITFEERKKIEKYIKAGMTGREIALYIKRSKTATNREIRLGGKKEYTAVKGQERADKDKDLQCGKISKALIDKGDSPLKLVFIRLQSLEMQVEILSELLKGLQK